MYAIGCNGAVVGTLMLCRQANTLGVYNLCVSPEFRNQGWGRNILDWVRAIAGTEGRIVTLQCDVCLADWYRRAGFTENGEITAYTRLAVSTFDTM